MFSVIFEQGPVPCHVASRTGKPLCEISAPASPGALSRAGQTPRTRKGLDPPAPWQRSTRLPSAASRGSRRWTLLMMQPFPGVPLGHTGPRSPHPCPGPTPAGAPAGQPPCRASHARVCQLTCLSCLSERGGFIQTSGIWQAPHDRHPKSAPEVHPLCLPVGQVDCP